MTNEILKEYKGIRTEFDDNHFQVFNNGECVFDETGPWAARRADEVFYNLKKELQSNEVPEPVTKSKHIPATEWTDEQVIQYAISMADAGAPSCNEPARTDYIELYRKLAITQGR